MFEEVDWDLEADVVMLGSGGAAMTAAIAAHDFGAEDVVILEKSGWSVGRPPRREACCRPNNPYQIEARIPDSDDEVVAYLDALAPGQLDPEFWAPS